MKSMAEAMKKAGVVTDADIKRIEDEERRIREKEEEQARQKARELREEQEYNWALFRLQNLAVAKEILVWREATGHLVPMKVLQEWASMEDKQGIFREWSKWLAARREELVS